MKQYPIEDIKAPAYLFVGGSVLFIKDNIKVQKTSTRTDVATSHAIKAGDIITDQAITIKGSPVAFSNTDALFKELKLVKGARIPKIESRISCQASESRSKNGLSLGDWGYYTFGG